MDDEKKKSVSKKRSKPSEFGFCFDSEDDEPIGAFLNLKRPLNSKKVKLGSGGEKSKTSKVGVEKTVVKDAREVMGGMDDTLASFRKKLKGPKKDCGLVTVAGTSLDFNGEQSAELSLNATVDRSILESVETSNEMICVDGSVMELERLEKRPKGKSRRKSKDGESDKKSVSKYVEKGKEVICVDGSFAESGVLEKRHKGTSRKRKTKLTPSMIEDHGDVVGDSLQSKRVEDIEEIEGSKYSSDDNKEDSLSAFVRKAQSTLVKKSRKSSELKAIEGIETSQSNSSMKLGHKNVKNISTGDKTSDTIWLDSALDQCMITGNQRSDNGLFQVSNCTKESLLADDPIQKPSSIVIIPDEILCSDKRHDTSLGSVLEDSVLVSSLPASQSGLVACSTKTMKLPDYEPGFQNNGNEEELLVGDPCSSNQHRDGDFEKNFHLQPEESVCDPNEKATSDVEEVDDPLKHSVMERLVVDPCSSNQCRDRDFEGDFLFKPEESVCDPKEKNTSYVKDVDDPLKHNGREIDVVESSEMEEKSNKSLNEATDQQKTPNASPNSPFQTSSPLLLRTVLEEAFKNEDKLDFGRYLEDSQHTQLRSTCSPFGSPKREESCNDDGGNEISSSHIEEPKREESCNDDGGNEVSSSHIEEPDQPSKDDTVSDDKLTSLPLMNLEKSLQTEDICNKTGHTEPTDGSHDNHFANGDTNGSSPSTNPDQNGSYLEVDHENKTNTLSELQRVVRKPKKRRLGDMAYEGDEDWEVLIGEQSFLESNQCLDTDRSLRMIEKLDSSLNVTIEAEKGGAAAISAGFKARAAGPLEKIKFKEILKRRGGLQEYLECRNQILLLWSKDVNCILTLADCGVTETTLKDEPQRASLIREIFSFLDRNAYINTGIVTEKEEPEATAENTCNHLKGNNSVRDSWPPTADSDDGVPYMGDHARDEYTGSGSISPKLINKLAKLDVLSGDNESVPFESPEIVNNSNRVEGNREMQSDSDGRKKIIIIGAGPAGLTAARHLQRQGFSVTILEGRSRIGGRVHTDRSSLSVPVDLGASIITGVEADVATERRPDPSSLVCAQLGLELTVLNSDCPLYDIITGQKVPEDLDQTMEAEYNSLLDDTVLVVAEKGEHAVKMSLEDGLEYALKRRFMDRSGMEHEETQVQNSILSPLENRVLNWHFANLEYGCATLLKEVSLPNWNQDDVYGGFGGAHCMIKGGYSTVIESIAEGLQVHLNHVVTDVSYGSNKVRVSTSNGSEFSGDAVLITVPLGCLKSETIKFSPPLPQWKHSSIQRLGFGLLNKVVLEFPEVFWDDSLDYFGATAEETAQRGHCFMFWNVKKTVGAPVLIALVVGKAAIDGQNISPSDHVGHALSILRKIFGEASVPDPVASVVTDWGRDPFAYGAYSYVAVGSSGEDYDILGRPVENCLFFAGEATCKEHPDTVGGAMMSGLREAVRINDILSTGCDYTAEVEAMEAAQRQSDSERNEVRDIMMRLEGSRVSNRVALLEDIFCNAKTIAGRLHLAKELLKLPVEALKSFAGTKEGLRTLNTWILDSMGKDGTQLLRHCVRLLVLVSTDLLAVRLSGIGKTVKDKVCVHTSRDIRAIASQLVNVWIEVFRKEKASNVGLKMLRQTSAADSSKTKSSKDPSSRKPPLNTNIKKSNGKPDVKSELESSRNSKQEEDDDIPISEEEKAAFAAVEAAHAAALAAAKAYASSEAECNALRQLPKIPSFHKFARRELYEQVDEYDVRRKWSGGVLGKQDCMSDIDSRNCKVRDWSVDFSAACHNLESSKISVDNLSQRSHSNEIGSQLHMREHSGESAAVDSSILTKAWVDSAGDSVGIKDFNAIERWQSQAEAADADFFQGLHFRDEEDSNTISKPPTHNESSVSQNTNNNKESLHNQQRGADRIKQAVVDYMASLLMPLYKARKLDKEGYKSIMKKSTTKVMEQTTDTEKAMRVYDFLDYKRKNKIRAFVDRLIERHMATHPVVK